MIDGRLLFPQSAKWPALSAFFRLPVDLRPTTVSVGENDVGEPIGVGDDLHSKLGPRTGFFLNGPNVSYDVNTVDPAQVVCNCFMDVPPAQAEVFLVRMASSGPLFAYICDSDEEEARNRIKNTVGINTIESWVGRNIERYIPGLFWLTLVPEALAAKHSVSIAAVAALALEHRELAAGQHLFRFYEEPVDWQKTDTIARFCASTPGIFNIEHVKSLLKDKTTLFDYTDVTRAWR